MKCVVYKSNEKPDAYLFIQREGDFSKVPESLLAMMGALQIVISLELTVNSPLAQARPDVVLQQLEDKGFYLQLPPADIELRTRYHQH